MGIWILIGVIVLIALAALVIYNGLVAKRNKVDEGWSGIDVQLKRRHDLIPNLVETVKGYATHEREVLENVTKARMQAVAASGPAESTQAENMLTGTLRQLFALSEAYPDLKANQNFLELQTQLSDTEDKISASRRIYNSNVRAYNTAIQQIPANIIAGMGHFTAREFFEIEDPAERQNVSVSFS